MKQFFPGPLTDTPRSIMRRIGYGETPGFKGEISYAKRIHGALFPRFHVYIAQKDGGMQVSIHLDQKAATYKGSHAHSGEYEGPLVEREMARIAQAIQSLPSLKPLQPTKKPETKKGFWGTLLGG